jgi:hypothetical protein
MRSISIETLKLYQMYLKRQQETYKHDVKKSVAENLAEYVLIGLVLDKVNYALDEVIAND